MKEIVEILASGFIGWLIGRHFDRGQRKLIEKLPETIVEKLRADPRKKLTVKQLNKLLEEKTIDNTKDGLKAFRRCPKCGSSKIWVGMDFDPYYEDEDTIAPGAYEKIECPKCGWSKDETGNETYKPIK